MGARRTDPRESPGLSRRDFLTKGLPGRVALLLGGGATTPAVTAAEAVRPDLVPCVSPRALRPMSREAVRAALARIRAQKRAR